MKVFQGGPDEGSSALIALQETLKYVDQIQRRVRKPVLAGINGGIRACGIDAADAVKAGLMQMPVHQHLGQKAHADAMRDQHAYCIPAG